MIDLAGGRVEPVELEDEMQRSFLEYAMSVIVERALPDVRDGLKPVHRASCTACRSPASRRTSRTGSAPASSVT